MFDQIAAGTNGSSRSRQVVSVAAGLAAAHGARFHLVWAYRTAAAMASAVAAADVMGTVMAADGDPAAEVEDSLRRLRRELVSTGFTVETYACPGGAADVLLDVAAHQSGDLIVVGNKGMHGARRVLGSIPNTIAHQASCSVLIVPTGP